MLSVSSYVYCEYTVCVLYMCYSTRSTVLLKYSMVTLEIRIYSTKERRFWEGSHLGGSRDGEEVVPKIFYDVSCRDVERSRCCLEVHKLQCCNTTH